MHVRHNDSNYVIKTSLRTVCVHQSSGRGGKNSNKLGDFIKNIRLNVSSCATYVLSLHVCFHLFTVFIHLLGLSLLCTTLRWKGPELNIFSEIVHCSVGGSERSLPVCERTEIKAFFIKALPGTGLHRVDDLENWKEQVVKRQHLFSYFMLYKVCFWK